MRKRKLADLALIFITAIWGLSFPIMRNSLDYISELSYLFYRFLFASVLLGIIFGKKYLTITKKEFFHGIILGGTLAGALGFTVIALNYTSASNVAFITGLNILIVPLISNIVFKNKIDFINKIGLGIAILGLFFISGSLELNFNFGDLLAFMCALCISAQIILTDYFTKTDHPIILGSLQINVATVVYFFLCLFTNIEFKFVLKPIVLFTIIVTGIAGTALAFVVQTCIQKYTEPSHVALIFILEPVFGAVFAMLIPNNEGDIEVISTIKVIGCILIILAMLITEIHKKNN